MSTELQQLGAAIAALEAQRSLLGDAVVDAMLAPARARLAALQGPAAAPAAAAEPAQVLRQVSILFLDVVGSTTLGQRLDPEGISAVMDDALARGTAVVQAHGGKVLQYAGDNILAAFGADEAREDDAERAVHCGLALLALGRVLGTEVLASHQHAGFDVRVGIHTGGVLLGGGVDAEGSIRGSAVNIAARMEQTAPAGALRISHDTWAQVRGLFEVQDQPPLAVKGVEQPVRSVLVLRAKPRQFRIGLRGIEGVATEMVGRDAELQQLQAAFRRLLAERRLATLTVVAEAGIGKSRLLHAFEAWAEAQPERVLLFRGRATPATGTQAFGLLRDILAWRLQIADDDPVALARQKLEAAIVPLFLHDDGPELAQAHAHLLGHLIGIAWGDSRHLKAILDDPRQIRSRALQVALAYFQRIAAREGLPVLLALEDLHWADGESLDFLLQLAGSAPDTPLLLLGLTRPTLFERRADWPPAGAAHQRLDLAALDRRTSRLLAQELLKKLPEVPAALQDLLTSRADGNPFYMEELVKMLIDQGAIRTGQAWAVDAGRLLATRVPPTLTGVLQARLDGLPPPERRALQQASVVGTVFWDQALAAIEAHAAEQLPALVQRELTLPRADAQLEGLREYAFRHQLLHQVIYDTVLKRHKREGHARVARWLARLGEEGSLRGGDLPGLAAEHFEQAGEPAEAAEYHARAAEQAGARLAHDRVLAHVARALQLLQGLPPDDGRARAQLHWRLLAVREKTLDTQSRRDEQKADLDALDALAERLDDDHLRADALVRRAFAAGRLPDWAQMERSARAAMACCARTRDDGLRLSALRLVALSLAYQGDLDAAATLAQQGLDEARQRGLRGIEGRMLVALGIIASRHQQPLRKLAFDRLSLAAFSEIGDRANEGVALSNLSNGWLDLGNLAQARQYGEAALQRVRANGDRWLESVTLCYLSLVHLWQGEAAPALPLAQQALAVAREARAGLVEVCAGLRVGEAELLLGRPAVARDTYTAVRARALEIGSPDHLDAAARLARMALAEGRPQAALAALEPVLAQVAGGGTLDGCEFPRLIEFSCWQVLAGAGDPRAAAWLARAHGAVQAQAQAIDDPALRQAYLQDIPHHRDIAAAWALHGPANPPPAGRHSQGSA